MPSKHYARWARRGAIYSLACLLLVFLDDPGRLLSPILGDSVSVREILPLRSTYWYQRLVSLSFRRPRPHNVTVLLLDKTTSASDEREVVDSDCLRRKFWALLVSRLATLSPKAIVFDRWNYPDTCKGPGETEESQALIDSIRAALPTIPVVSGLRDYTQEELRAKDPKLIERLSKANVGKTVLIIEPSLFDGPDKESLGPSLALLRLASDPTNAVLYWNAIKRSDAAASVRRYPSLASAVVSAVDPDASGPSSRFGQAMRTGRQAVDVSFIDPALMAAADPIDLICGDGNRDWQHCGWLPSTDLRRRISHHIVELGVDEPQDISDTPFGPLAGAMVHANWIEAFLDDRVLFAVPWYVELAIIASGLILIEALFKRESIQPVGRFGLAMSVSILWIAGIYVIGISLTGFYVSSWPALLIASLGHYIACHRDKMAEALKKVIQSGEDKGAS
jgi:hypothetical protein